MPTNQHEIGPASKENRVTRYESDITSSTTAPVKIQRFHTPTQSIGSHNLPNGKHRFLSRCLGWLDVEPRDDLKVHPVSIEQAHTKPGALAVAAMFFFGMGTWCVNVSHGFLLLIATFCSSPASLCFMMYLPLFDGCSTLYVLTSLPFISFVPLSCLLLILLFGITYRVSVNTLFAELPILITTQPEGSNLALYVILTQQIANVLLVITYRFFLSGASQWTIRTFTLGIILVSLFGSIVLSLAYDITTEKTENGHNEGISVVLLIVAIALGFCSACTNVVCWGFVSLYPQIFSVVYSVGQGASSALTGGAAVLQGAGNKKNVTDSSGNVTEVNDLTFTVGLFFMLCAILVFLMLIAYVFLLISGQGSLERRKQKILNASTKPGQTNNVTTEEAEDFVGGTEEGAVPLPSGLLINHSSETDQNHEAIKSEGGTKEEASLSSLLTHSRQTEEEPRPNHHQQQSKRLPMVSQSSGRGGHINIEVNGKDNDTPSTVPIIPLSPPCLPSSSSSPSSSPSTSSTFLMVDLSHAHGFRILGIRALDISCLATVSAMTYGLFPAILPFVCLNYVSGGKVYSLSAAINYIADPVGRLIIAIPLIRRQLFRPLIVIFFSCINISATIIGIVIASQSPYPMGLDDSATGFPTISYLPVILMGLVSMSFAISHTTTFLRMHGITAASIDPRLGSEGLQLLTNNKITPAPPASNTPWLIARSLGEGSLIVPLKDAVGGEGSEANDSQPPPHPQGSRTLLSLNKSEQSERDEKERPMGCTKMGDDRKGNGDLLTTSFTSRVLGNEVIEEGKGVESNRNEAKTTRSCAEIDTDSGVERDGESTMEENGVNDRLWYGLFKSEVFHRRRDGQPSPFDATSIPQSGSDEDEGGRGAVVHTSNSTNSKPHHLIITTLDSFPPSSAVEAAREHLFREAGLIIQVGSCIGAVLALILTVATKAFAEPIER